MPLWLSQSINNCFKYTSVVHFSAFVILATETSASLPLWRLKLWLISTLATITQIFRALTWLRKFDAAPRSRCSNERKVSLFVNLCLLHMQAFNELELFSCRKFTSPTCRKWESGILLFDSFHQRDSPAF